MPRITEADVVDAVEEILSERPNGEATIAELIHELPNRLTLSKEDWVQSTTRPNEPMWHQQVRNITSHKNFGYGRLVAIPGGLALASKAKAPTT